MAASALSLSMNCIHPLLSPALSTENKGVFVAKSHSQPKMTRAGSCDPATSLCVNMLVFTCLKRSQGDASCLALKYSEKHHYWCPCCIFFSPTLNHKMHRNQERNLVHERFYVPLATHMCLSFHFWTEILCFRSRLKVRYAVFLSMKESFFCVLFWCSECCWGFVVIVCF